MQLVVSKASLASQVREGEGTHRRTARRQHTVWALDRTDTITRAAAPGRCGCADMARAARPPGSTVTHGAGATVTAQHASGAAARSSARPAPVGVLVNDCTTALRSAAACTPARTACAPYVQSLSAAQARNAVKCGASIVSQGRQHCAARTDFSLLICKQGQDLTCCWLKARHQ